MTHYASADAGTNEKDLASLRQQESAFQEILGMMPNEEERRLCQKLLVDTMVHLGDRSVSDPKERARRNLVQALFNHNDFITIR